MLAGARRNRRVPAPGLRGEDPSPGRGTGNDGGSDSSDLYLRLALAQGTLGIETTRPIEVGPFELTELQLKLRGVKFPIDLSGGVRRFRHMRGQAVSARFEIPLSKTATAAQRRVRKALPKCERVVIAAAVDGLMIGVASEDWALAFDVVVAPQGRDLRLIVENARGDGLDDAAHIAALRVAAAMLGELSSERFGSAFVLRDPLREVLQQVLPDAGARAPSTLELLVSIGVADDGKAGRVVLRWGAVRPALSMRAIRALETAELLMEADDDVITGEQDKARIAYLSALERAPRHPEAAARLAALDFAIGAAGEGGNGRAEAALVTLIDAGSAMDAGLLGSHVLEAIGDQASSYDAAAKAAANEPFSWLAARAWLRAGSLAPDARAAAVALDEALVRAPSLDAARWKRIELRLARGDARLALGDVAHLEANASSRELRHTSLLRAAELFWQRGFTEEAEHLFEQALRYEPKSARAVAGLARTLRDRGKTARALDLFARALATRKPDDPPSHDIEIDLAQALAVYANDRSSAIARVATVPQDAMLAPRARALEATWRTELGDRPGAARALSRLRSIAETIAEVPRPRGAESETITVLASALDTAAHLDEDAGDLRAARRDLELLVRIRPDRASQGRLAKMARAAMPQPQEAEPMPDVGLSETREVPALSVLPIRDLLGDARPVEAPTPPPRFHFDSPATEMPAAHLDLGLEDDEDLGELDQRVDALTSQLRANPHDQVAATELATLLERLGRDMELLALLSARMEESPDVGPDLLAQHTSVLRRLADTARAEGRSSEAELYEMMIRR